jgi:hypothetical protein
MQIKGFNRWHNRKHSSDGLIDGYLTSDGFTDDGNDLMEFLFYPADGYLMEMVMEYREPMHCLFCVLMEIW